MSKQTRISRKTVKDIAAAKGGEPLVCLTAYDAPMAEIMDPHADLILVGDSLGMVVHGLPSTVGVTMEMMILHGQAVMRGSQQAFVVVDMWDKHWCSEYWCKDSRECPCALRIRHSHVDTQKVAG